jgi:hypothetical protein
MPAIVFVIKARQCLVVLASSARVERVFNIASIMHSSFGKNAKDEE